MHTSWRNQIEIYFSAVRGKVVSPNHFTDLAAVADRRCCHIRDLEVTGGHLV